MGKYKNGKPNEEISVEDLRNALDNAYFVDDLLHKSYVVAVYWVGARRCEPLEVKGEDIQVKEGILFMDIPAFKHGQRGGQVELPVEWCGVDLIVERWLEVNKSERMWPFETSTAYRIIKRIWPKRSPHWLRYNRLTELRWLRDQKKVSTDQIKSYTGIKSDSTIEHYGMRTQSQIHRVAKAMNEAANP